MYNIIIIIMILCMHAPMCTCAVYRIRFHVQNLIHIIYMQVIVSRQHNNIMTLCYNIMLYNYYDTILYNCVSKLIHVCYHQE